MTALSALRERVEKAQGPDRELDAAIWFALFMPEYRFPDSVLNRVPSDLCEAYERHHHDGYGGVSKPLPAYTSSLDAALALVTRVLPGWKCMIAEDENNPGYWGAVLKSPGVRGFRKLHDAEAPTPALALCLALVRAMEEK